MKRLASHFIFLPQHELFRLHYIELNERNIIEKIAPLNEEIASTSFFSGYLFVINSGMIFSPTGFFEQNFDIEQPVSVYHANSLPSDCSSPELGASYGGCNGHIQRIG